MSTENPNKPRLVLVEYKQNQPKAKRIFWMFKARESVTGEPFNLRLTFKNTSKQEFSGGKCHVYIDTAEGTALTPYEIEIPAIAPKGIVSIVYEDLVIQETGYSAFRIRVYNNNNEKMLEDDNHHRLTNATPEELYQKYAVVVALLFSTLATILTIVNILVSLFR